MEPIKLARQQQAAAAKAKLQEATARLRTNGGMAPSVLARFETKGMNNMTLNISISTGTYSVEQLAKLVAAASQRGEYYDGCETTHIEDWLAEGNFDGTETIESLAAEWDY